MHHPQVEPVPLFGGEQGPGLAGLGLALGREIDVDPPREQVLGVPGGLAVAQEDQVGHIFERTQAAPRRRITHRQGQPGRGWARSVGFVASRGWFRPFPVPSARFPFRGLAPEIAKSPAKKLTV